MSTEKRKQLAAPFAVGEVQFKAQAVSKDKTRALAVAYIDARAVEDRLDEVFGIDGWQDSYTQLPAGPIVCRLRCKFGDVWIEKVDVGALGDQNDSDHAKPGFKRDVEGDRTKAGFSDALKRAAVKFGIGRYLYSLPKMWFDWDEAKRDFKVQPRLPGQTPPPAQKPASPPQQKPTAPPTGSAPQPAATLPGMGQQSAATRPAQRTPPCITDDQRQAIARFLEDRGVEETDFLQHYSIAKLADLPAGKYQDAMQRLAQRTGRRAG